MITVGLIGIGQGPFSIGKHHLQTYLELPDLYTVKYVCDLDEATARAQIKEKTGDENSIAVVSDMDVLFDDPDIDLVDVCLPPSLHLDVSLKGLQSGKHVVCEKPLVTSLADADTLVNAAKANNVILCPVFQYRYGKAMTQFEALRDADLLGKPYVGALNIHWERQKSYFDENEWRGTWKGDSGGCVLIHAIHHHDLMNCFFGDIQSVYALTTTRVNDVETEDCASISLEMKSGALASSSITLGASGSHTNMRFTFEKLTMEMGLPKTQEFAGPMMLDWKFTARAPYEQAKIDAVLAKVEHDKDFFQGYFTELAKAIAGKPNKAITAEAGRRSIEFVTAVYYSAKTGETVNLPLTPEHPYYKGWC